MSIEVILKSGRTRQVSDAAIALAYALRIPLTEVALEFAAKPNTLAVIVREG